jgi:serine/threonine-protein kinase
MDTQVTDTLLGSLIGGRYRIRGRVARGGMTTVYTAVDERLGRTVALKIIHAAQSRDPHFLERFTDEAETIARLTHPNVVAVYDQGTHAGLPYLVMEYVRGRTLREVLAQRGRLNPVEAMAILEQMLAAIAAAHRAGLVHRDVKPENVLVAEAPSGGPGNLVDGVVKVADFGLAQAVEASTDDAAGGQLMATVAYVAPELVTDGHADARTDVYSAGIVLFEMLTGRVPYHGDRPVDIAWQHVDRDVPPPSQIIAGLPPVLDDLVARATRRDPGARPTDAGALLAEVQAAGDDLGTVNADNATTALLRPVAQPTVGVPPVQPAHRPAWARLPGDGARPGPGRRRAAASPPGLTRMLTELRANLLVSSGGRTALAAAVLVLALLAGVGGWWFGFGRYTVAPQLLTMSKTDAERQAARAGLKIVYDAGRYDEKVAKDVVLAQSPPPKGRIVKGGKIRLTLSLGPERHIVPDVVGMEFDVATAQLQAANLVVVRAPDRFNDDIPAGSVVAIDPKPGTQVKRDTQVKVWVSKGRAPITVPRVVGLNINDATNQLQQLGLTVVPEYKDSDKPQGQVIGQSPSDGAGVEQGAEIKLQVSKGAALVPVPDVQSPQNIPCQQAGQIIQQAGLTPQLNGDSEAAARAQNPPPGTQVAPGTPVAVWCF